LKEFSGLKMKKGVEPFNFNHKN